MDLAEILTFIPKGRRGHAKACGKWSCMKNMHAQGNAFVGGADRCKANLVSVVSHREFCLPAEDGLAVSHGDPTILRVQLVNLHCGFEHEGSPSETWSQPQRQPPRQTQGTFTALHLCSPQTVTCQDSSERWPSQTLYTGMVYGICLKNIGPRCDNDNDHLTCRLSVRKGRWTAAGNLGQSCVTHKKLVLAPSTLAP